MLDARLVCLCECVCVYSGRKWGFLFGWSGGVEVCEEGAVIWINGACVFDTMGSVYLKEWGVCI